jgi:hypothetical protein
MGRTDGMNVWYFALAFMGFLVAQDLWQSPQNGKTEFVTARVGD